MKDHIYKEIQSKLLSDCEKSIFGEYDTTTHSDKVVTPEEIFKDIQEAIELLQPKKKPSFNYQAWECLKHFNEPILKITPIVITMPTA